jgi:hypothetical protein
MPASSINTVHPFLLRQTVVVNLDFAEDTYRVSATNLTFIDLYTDPLGWRGTSTPRVQDIWTDLAQLKCEGLFYVAAFGDAPGAVLVIDSLSSLLLHHPFEVVHSNLSQLIGNQGALLSLLFLTKQKNSLAYWWFCTLICMTLL